MMSDSADFARQPRTIIEIRPCRGGWHCFESPGVQPYWAGKDAKRASTTRPIARNVHLILQIFRQARPEMQENAI